MTNVLYVDWTEKMLSKEQEDAANQILAKCKSDREKSMRVFGFADSRTENLIFIISKLLEVNNEAARYSEELYKVNKELADLREHYEC